MADRKPVEFVDHPMAFPTTMEWRGVCRHVVDGDTLDVLLDKGLNKYDYETLRLRDINARELHGGTAESRAAALADKAFTVDRVLNRPVRVRTFKDERTFGRYVADVWYWDSVGVAHLLNEELALEIRGHDAGGLRP